MPSICYNCVCIKHNFGLPHLVSSPAWHRHLDQASSEEERQRIHKAKYQGLPQPSRGTGPRRQPARPKRGRQQISH
ncbi:hypothetical protein J3R82DRAFT_6268 [Butyriboletus roseoflavus]|nr:hypothetical protein J3R82DRAFT_6268 [Butyriboletus roseoflavus]